MNALQGKRIMVCGKGGSGKSSLVSIMADILQEKDYRVLVLDGDASNPEGLIRLIIGGGVEDEPKPLIEYFGGIETVTCPVDDPSPLKRMGDQTPVPEKRIDIDNEIPPEYYRRKKNITLFSVGKINKYGQGCDGPVEKVVRDFQVVGEWVSLIDMKAGTEHFGRKIPDTMDVILIVLDPTLESVSIAKRIHEFHQLKGWGELWLILNKSESEEMTSIILEKLGKLKTKVIGTVAYDPQVSRAGLEGGVPLWGKTRIEVAEIVDRLEQEKNLM